MSEEKEWTKLTSKEKLPAKIVVATLVLALVSVLFWTLDDTNVFISFGDSIFSTFFTALIVLDIWIVSNWVFSKGGG